MQYRSGPRGFLHHLGGNTIGFPDFHVNQQFVSVGNIESENKVALFVADYRYKVRLKLFGRARVLDADDDQDLFDELRHVNGAEIATRCERSIIVDVEAYDWNCARSLIPQYTSEEVTARVQPYVDTIAELRARIEELKTR